ncbi:MAG: glycosyltransferase family 9 protein [Bacteroidia bacterium]|nr:glycosyltransferase family 9 protein [Bacteroidia bacterium]
MKKILVIQTAFIGDVILATSVLEKLHGHYSGAEIFLLVRKGNESLFADHPFLKETLVWNKQQGKYSSLFKMLKRIRKEKFDLVVNLHRHASSGFLSAFSGSKKIVGFDKNPFSFLFTGKQKHIIGRDYHETGRNHSLIREFTDEHPAKPKLYPSPEQNEKVRIYKAAKYVCMAPASVWFTKQWPEKKWVDLCKEFSEKKIYLLGGPGDKVLCNRIASASGKENVINLAGELDFLESASLMRDAKMNFVNDSGPLHLASAVNAPVTAIYCSTVPEFGFFPLSDKSFIVQAEEELACRPCGLHGFKTCPEKHFKCGFGITVQQVKNPS